AVTGNGSGGGLVDGLLGMMMWNQTSKNGENGGELPVVKLQQSEPTVLESATKLPVAKVHSAKPPASRANSPVANSEPDSDSRFDELPFDDRSFS
ncbi:flotillin family protein, partial [Microcoleus sp. K4-C2]